MGDVDSFNSIYSMGNVKLWVNGVNWTEYSPLYLEDNEGEWSKDTGMSRDSVKLLLNRMLADCNEHRFNGGVQDKRTRVLCEQLEEFVGKLYVVFIYPELHSEIVSVNESSQKQFRELREENRELRVSLEEQIIKQELQAQNNWDLTRRLSESNKQEIIVLAEKMDREFVLLGESQEFLGAAIVNTQEKIGVLEKINESESFKQWLVMGLLCVFALLEVAYIVVVRLLRERRK